jgi:Tfp pilus assembly protein FimT
MRSGFTLIELMVVVMVSMILVGVGVVSVSGVLTRQRVLSAQSEVISALKMARNYAVTSQSPSGYANQLDYISVTVNSSGMILVQPVNLAAGVGTSYFSKDTTGDKVVLVPSSATLLFSVPEGKVLLNSTTPANSSYVMTVGVSSVEGSGETAVVQVDAGGKIW